MIRCRCYIHAVYAADFAITLLHDTFTQSRCFDMSFDVYADFATLEALHDISPSLIFMLAYAAHIAAHAYCAAAMRDAAMPICAPCRCASV